MLDGIRDTEADKTVLEDGPGSPGQQIPGVTPVRGEVLPMPDGGVLPETAEEIYAAASRVAPAAIEVVNSRGKKGLKDLKQALIEAGFMDE
jgi:hypothetical protein